MDSLNLYDNECFTDANENRVYSNCNPNQTLLLPTMLIYNSLLFLTIYNKIFRSTYYFNEYSIDISEKFTKKHSYILFRVGGGTMFGCNSCCVWSRYLLCLIAIVIMIISAKYHINL